jgi:flagella basal body P-ring formation protein FlgA
VAARDLSRGTSLARADIAYRDTVVWGAGAPGAVEAGWKTARRIPAGALLDRPAVAPPPAVVAGHAVTVVWRGQGLEVTTRGVAAGTAAAGDRVAVRTESGRRLWGVAVSPDRVEIEGSRK